MQYGIDQYDGYMGIIVVRHKNNIQFTVENT